MTNINAIVAQIQDTGEELESLNRALDVRQGIARRVVAGSRSDASQMAEMDLRAFDAAVQIRPAVTGAKLRAAEHAAAVELVSALAVEAAELRAIGRAERAVVAGLKRDLRSLEDSIGQPGTKLRGPEGAPAKIAALRAKLKELCG